MFQSKLDRHILFLTMRYRVNRQQSCTIDGLRTDCSRPTPACTDRRRTAYRGNMAKKQQRTWLGSWTRNTCSCHTSTIWSVSARRSLGEPRVIDKDFVQAIEAHLKGHPLQRPMFVEFPSDRTTHTLDRQFMLGPALLVAPVFVHEGEVSEYYLPAGRWTSFFHPERVLVGPQWVREVVPINEIPVWVFPGTALCLGPSQMGRPDYDYTKNLEVRVYELDDGQSTSAVVPTGQGTVIGGAVFCTRKKDNIEVILDGQLERETTKVTVYNEDKKMNVVWIRS